MQNAIGISNDLRRAKLLSREKYKRLKNWMVVSRPCSKERAVAISARLAEEYRIRVECDEDGGLAGGCSWYVYYFEHEGEKIAVPVKKTAHAGAP